MKRTIPWVVAAVAALWVGGCEPHPTPDATTSTTETHTGIAWPRGDATQGRQAFQDLGCSSCHRVDGAADLPKPSASPEVPVVLGGKNTAAKSEAELLTAIVNPSHDLAEGMEPAAVSSGGKSRMGDYARVMTVEQLVDVVAFLRSTEPAKSAMAR